MIGRLGANVAAWTTHGAVTTSQVEAPGRLSYKDSHYGH
jgi:hypothetical protein